MRNEGFLGLGILKGYRSGSPRTEQERKERHMQLFGNMNLPQRGTGRGIFGLGILSNLQSRFETITKQGFLRNLGDRVGGKRY